MRSAKRGFGCGTISWGQSARGVFARGRAPFKSLPVYVPGNSQGKSHGAKSRAILDADASENRSVGGSILPLGTILFKDLADYGVRCVMAIGSGAAPQAVPIRRLRGETGPLKSAAGSPIQERS